MKIIVIAFMLLFLFSILLGLMIAPAFGKVHVCVPAEIEGIIAWIPGQIDGLPQDDNQALANALYAMRGPHFGFKRGDYVGMNIPDDAKAEAQFVMLPTGQSIEFWSAESEPGAIYVYWYPNDRVFTVSKPSGNYYGKHPCNDMKVSRAVAEEVYRLVKYAD